MSPTSVSVPNPPAKCRVTDSDGAVALQRHSYTVCAIGDAGCTTVALTFPGGASDAHATLVTTTLATTTPARIESGGMEAPTNNRWRLRIQTPAGTLRSIDLPRQGQWRLGRATTADLALDDPSASHAHAELRWTGAVFEVRDCGSRFGTFLDRERVTDRWAPWTSDATLWVGSCGLTRLIVPASLSDETVALDVAREDDTFASRIALASQPLAMSAEAGQPPVSPEAATNAPSVPTLSPARRAERLVATVGVFVASATLLSIASLWFWVFAA